MNHLDARKSSETTQNVLAWLFKNELQLLKLYKYASRMRAIIAIVIAMVSISDQARSQQRSKELKGRIVDEKKLGIPDANIRIAGEKRFSISNSSGSFSLPGVSIGDTLIISRVGYEGLKLQIKSFDLGNLVLREGNNRLMDIDIVNTGYQIVPRERATGSFVQIDEKLLNRRVSTNILDRLEGITSGLSFNRNISTSNRSNPSALSVRGRSTIFANPNPLIVVDNFPFTGNLASINPSDIASIKVLKDAAAASIWGVLSGNGVIVITTKRGSPNSAPKVDFSANVTIGERPDLYYAPRLSSTSFIDVEKFLFDKGYYNFRITSTARPVLSPVVEVLLQRRNGQLSAADSAALISGYAHTDTREDLAKYFYRNTLDQHYNLSVSGGGENNSYYFSGGLDRNLAELKRNNFNRITITGSNTFLFAKKKTRMDDGPIFYPKPFGKQRCEFEFWLSLFKT